MISRRTKLQLLVFVAITLLGVSYVGAKYARLDRLVSSQAYTVTAHFKQSGGIFVGAEVSYRGVGVGRVSNMTLTSSGVDVALEIDNSHPNIPADTLAVVADRSAVGEQFVDLQPRTDSRPYLSSGSQIAAADTRTPLPTTKLLVNLDDLVNSVNKKNLGVVIDQLGRSFQNTGPDLARIIDTSNSFIETANNNFRLTTNLIRDGGTVLKTQLDESANIKSFAHNLALFSNTLVRSDHDLRRVIDNGSGAATTLRTFIAQNRADLSALFSHLLTTGQIVEAKLPGIAQILVLYPYVVEGGFTVIGKDPATGLYDAHFGLVLTQNPPVCHSGYQGTPQRTPQDRQETPLNVRAHCDEPPSQSNARGAQNASYDRAPVVATYNLRTGQLTPTPKHQPSVSSSASDGARVFGSDNLSWLFLGALGQ
ncbi:MAG: MCE family protein [Nocardioidaceae bacterium]